MNRVPVVVKQGWVPPGSAAWVPRKRTIIVKDPVYVYPSLIAHELRHVMQRERFGWRFLPIYLWQWAREWFRYKEIDFEEEAREDADDPFLLDWAYDLVRDWRRNEQ